VVSLCIGILLLSGFEAWGDVARRTIEGDAYAVIRNGRSAYLECEPPPGNAAKAFLQKYLRQDEDWKLYAGKGRVAIPFRLLKPAVQRALLFAVFPEDAVDERGWTHVVIFGDGGKDEESLDAWCEWLTGGMENKKWVVAANGLASTRLRPGQEVLFPADLLREVMKAPTASRSRHEPEPEFEYAALEEAAAELTYGSDKLGPYAKYRLKPSESLYTAVVVRFTDIHDNESILKACETVRKRSGIKNVHAMPAGQRVLIPVKLLSDRFKPHADPDRQEYEASLREAKRLAGKVKTRDLDGVVVVLDPGHGGHDHGARNGKFRLYEDELNYDIACRVKHLLESQTRAQVYVTVKDRSQGYSPVNHSRFRHDTDEELLTTPRYPNTDARVSANLRWCLANSIYRKETGKGADPLKIVFTSFHCDALFNEELRGAMIYVPGARRRRDREAVSQTQLGLCREVKEERYATSTAAERKRDEAVSRNFAAAILEALGAKRIKRHNVGDPIRTQICQDGGKVYLPAVLRNTKIPTKVLVEAANLTNATDCQRLADAEWRQAFAQAYVDALKAHFGS
jgi:N-acetylmuramoyl-L-alanine amidase